MKCVLTSRGFISQHLSLALLEIGHEVKVLSRNLLADPVKLKEYIEFEKPDYIFHTSAYGNNYDQVDDDVTFYTNIENSWNLLKAIKDTEIKKMIVFGSSSEYGLKKDPMKESDKTDTKTLYGATKVAVTQLCQAYANKYKKNISVCRPFSVYGEGDAAFKFIPRVIESLKSGKKFPLDPYPKHDFIYISDFIEGVIKCLDTTEPIINIGTGKQVTNMEVVNTLEEIAGTKANYSLVNNLRGYDNDNWVADNSLLTSLGWKQSHSLREGLKKTYERTI